MLFRRSLVTRGTRGAAELLLARSGRAAAVNRLVQNRKRVMQQGGAGLALRWRARCVARLR